MSYQPYYLSLIQEINACLYKHDPMKLNSPYDDEYDAEALSITARVLEVGMDISDESGSKVTIVNDIVHDALLHWFEMDVPNYNALRLLSSEILSIYCNWCKSCEVNK